MFQWLISIIEHYGYLVLFASFTLEMIAVPLPGEALMSYAGYLVYQGKLNWGLSIISAGLGASLGMTLSFWFGFKLGNPFFKKYGHYVHMGPERMAKIANWYDHYGNRLILIAYFIPGIRHITGYFSGITKLSFRNFTLFAYIGALIWVSTFISLGKLLGPQWEQFHNSIKKYLLIGGIILSILLIIFYLYRYFRTPIRQKLNLIINQATTRLNSLGRVKAVVVSMAIAFISFFTLMMGLIQDFLANEFVKFDEITKLVVNLVFNENWTSWMSVFQLFSSILLLLPIIGFSIGWILLKSNFKKLDLIFYVFIIIGGELYEEGLHYLFKTAWPRQSLLHHFSFPSEQSLISLIIYGYFSYILYRSSFSLSVKQLLFFLTIIILALIGFSKIYYGIQLPSDIVAGYIFGGVWLTLNLIILEVFRLIQKSETSSLI